MKHRGCNEGKSLNVETFSILYALHISNGETQKQILTTSFYSLIYCSTIIIDIYSCIEKMWLEWRLHVL